MRLNGPPSAMSRFKFKGEDGDGATLIEQYVDTGLPFYLGAFRFGHESLDMSIPIEVYARTEDSEIIVWCENMPFYGIGKNAKEAFRDFSSVVIGGVQVFYRDDSPVPQLKRLLAHHIEGVR